MTYHRLVKGFVRQYRSGVSSMGKAMDHQPVDPAYFPYGDSSWESIASSKKFFVDKTEAISHMEKTGIHLKLWRPRRFRKTLFCDQLAHYYDVLISGKEEIGIHVLRIANQTMIFNEYCANVGFSATLWQYFYPAKSNDESWQVHGVIFEFQ
jgi:hypothetical protein